MSQDTDDDFFNNTLNFLNKLDIRQLDVFVGTLNSSVRTFRALQNFAGRDPDSQEILDNIYTGILCHIFGLRGCAVYNDYIYNPISNVMSFCSRSSLRYLPNSISNILLYFSGDIYEIYKRINENTLLNTYPQAVSIGSGVASNLLATATHNYNNGSSTMSNTSFIIDSAFKASVAFWFVMFTLNNAAKSHYTYNESRLKTFCDIALLRQSGIKFFKDVNEKYVSKNDVLLDLINNNDDYKNHKESLSKILNSALFFSENAVSYKLNMENAFSFGGADYTYEVATIWENLLIRAKTHTILPAPNQARSRIPGPVGIPQDTREPQRPRAYTLGARPPWK